MGGSIFMQCIMSKDFSGTVVPGAFFPGPRAIIYYQTDWLPVPATRDW